MKVRFFSLRPFPSPVLAPEMKIAGAVGRKGNTLSIGYTLNGFSGKAQIPSPARELARRNGLWQETCFEFFLAAGNAGPYREFNLSPSGHWNVYTFLAYRRGMREDPDFESLPFTVHASKNALTLSLTVDLQQIMAAEEPLLLGIAAVIKQRKGESTFWALCHPGPQPDFHRRDSFLIGLPPDLMTS